MHVCDALHIGYAHTHTHTHTGMISSRSLAAAGPAACPPSGDGSPSAAAAPRDVDDTMAGWLGGVPVWYVKYEGRKDRGQDTLMETSMRFRAEP